MKKQKPWIAIVCSRNAAKKNDDIIPNELSPAYSMSVVNAGGLPALIPIDFPLSELETLRCRFDGLILAGGCDVATERYNGDSTLPTSVPDVERDELEIQLTRLAIASGWPILGICRGTQVMNVAMGGTLITDIPSQKKTNVVHQSGSETPRESEIHLVTFAENSMIKSIIGQETLMVNTFHHQAVDRLAPCFHATGFCTEDGITETIEGSSSSFMLGVQWHPECMQHLLNHRKIFSALIDACAEGMK